MTSFHEGVGSLRAEYGASLSAGVCTPHPASASGSGHAEYSEPADRRPSAGAKDTTCQAGAVPLSPTNRPTLAVENMGDVRDPSQFVAHEEPS